MNLLHDVSDAIQSFCTETKTKCDWCAESIYKNGIIFEIGTKTFCSKVCIRELNAKRKEDVIRGVLRRNPKAKFEPVWNFVGTAGDNSADNAGNLQLDASLYGWDAATVDAIKEGLTLLGKLVR
jgi:hypothetical protein